MWLFNNGTNVVDVVSYLSSLTLGTALPATSGGTGQSSYAVGDLLYASTTSALTRLAAGTAGQLLQTNGAAAPSWVNAPTFTGVSSFSAGSTGFTPTTATTGAVSLAGTLGAGYGGTGQSTYTIGDILYASAATTLSKLSAGTAGQVLSANGAASNPTWLSQSSIVAGSATNVAGGAANRIPYQSGANTTTFVTAPTTASTFLGWNGSSFAWLGVGSGTLQSDENTAFGTRALNSNSGSIRNIAIGFESLVNFSGSSGGGGHTAIGYSAGYEQRSGTAANTYLGAYAGYKADAVACTFLGAYTGPQSGGFGVYYAPQYCTAVGYDAGSNFQTGSYNDAFGVQALRAVTTTSYNVAMGSRSLFYTVSNYNAAVGFEALWSHNTSSGSNTAVGYRAGYSATTGGSVYVGREAGLTSSGADCVYIGFIAGSNYTVGTTYTGAENTGVGSNSLKAIQTGERNTAVGAYSNITGTTGSYNVHIGDGANVSSASVSNETVVGYGIAGKGANTAFIGGTSGAYNGANVTTWATTSDQRIKRNIVDSPKGLAEINQLRVRNFQYKEEADMPKTEDGKPVVTGLNPEKLITGFIAQEIQTVFPEAVQTHAHDILSVSADPVIYALVKAIQELTARLEALEARN
jgi:hypothetical protein